MKLGVERPALLVDVTRLPRDRSRHVRRRAAHRRRRAQQRPRRRPARARALPGARRGAAGRRLGPAAQPGDRRRQPAPAHPLLLLPGRHQAVQQARARAPAARRARASTATSRSSGTPSTASPPTRPTWRSRWPRSTPRSQRRRRATRAAIPLASCTACPGDEPQHDTVLEPGELITAVDAAAAPRRRRSRTARCATARRSRSRWCRSPPRSTSATARRDAGSRSAASPTSRGARERAEAALRGGRAAPSASRAPTPSWPQARAAARQRLQGAAGPQPDRPHARRSWRDERRPTPPLGAPLDADRGPREGHRARPRYAYEHQPRATSPTRGSCRRTIARGRGRRGRRRRRARRPGVLAVLCARERAARCSEADDARAGRPADAAGRLPRADRRARSSPTTLEAAREAAALVRDRVRRASAHDVVLRADHPRLYAPEKVNPASRPTPTRATSTRRSPSAAVARRRDLHDAGGAQQPDGAARDHRALGAAATLTLYDSNQGASARARRDRRRCSASSPSRCA